MKWLKFKLIHPDAKLPVRATPGAAGLDVFAVEQTYVFKDMVSIVATGLQTEIPEGYELQVRPRSGLVVRYGVTVANAPGTIDSDYRGEIKILLVKLFDGPPHVVQKGDRIAQLVLAEVEAVIAEEVDDLSDTERGDGAFGSTGR